MLCALLALAGCGGSSSGAETAVNPPPNNSGGNDGFSYKGQNSAASEDVVKFQTRLWVNIAPENRCGSCHNTQQPTFARTDDINLAYAAMIDNGLVDLANPSMSVLVSKVVGGHNCWQGDAVACGDILTTWISAWAENNGTEANSLVLKPPEEKDVNNSKNFPESAEAFAYSVHPLLREHCASCHSEAAATRQQPYFGSSDLDVAYEAAKARIRLDNPAASRLVQRLATDFHNCWDNDCVKSANGMQAAIAQFADGIEPIAIDENLVLSKAVGLEDAFVLSSGGRVDTDLIAKYEFKTGSGTVAYDTSGVEPATNLNLIGNVGWSSAWGIKIGANGKAQASTSESRKIYNLIRGAGEYSIEAWIIPDNVSQGTNDNNPARIVSLSGSAETRNFTLGQYEYNYSFLNRTNRSDANGLDELATNANDQRLQATLQHVVATFDPINGRRIYVNGEFTGDIDPEAGAVLADWDNSYAFVLGNEVSNNRLWQGSIRFIGVHKRAMAAENILKNFEVGVGARYLLLFNISALIEVPYSYIVFEVQQFDDYGYLFNQPFFTILADPATGQTASLTRDIDLQGLRIGINGEEVRVGQIYARLDTTISANQMIDGQQRLSNLGTVVEAKKGPDLDVFFLTFDRLGAHSYSRAPVSIPAPAAPADIPDQAVIGVRTFAAINATLSTLTTVPATTPDVAGTYANVQQQLPTVANLEGFLAAHQMGVTQLTVSYCNALVKDLDLRAHYFPDFSFGATPASAFTDSGRDALIEPLLKALLAHEINGNKLENQADPDELRLELNLLIDRMRSSTGTTDIAMATCAAAFGSAVMLLQ